MSVYTPNRSCIQPNISTILEKSIILRQNQRKLQKSIKWGLLNAALLLILIYYISDSCLLSMTYYNYCQYFLISILFVNLIYHVIHVIYLLLSRKEQIPITLEQKKLLGVADSDPNFKVVENSMKITPNRAQTQQQTFNQILNSTNPSTTPINMTAISWRSNLSSQNDSLNYSMSSPSWTYHKGSPSPYSSNIQSATPLRTTPPKSINDNSIIKPRDTSGVDFISNDKDLEKYLKDYETNSSLNNISNHSQQPMNLLSSFWSHPVTKTAKDMSMFLKSCRYQLSSQSPSKSTTNSPKNKIDDKTPVDTQTSALVAWTRMNVDIVSLTQWNENLRKWISQTILERLVKEFDTINESLEKQGFTDIKIGHVGLDRLRKTAQISHITQFIPSLSTIVPFLEANANQEYLVKRIRELCKGGCISEFRWNGGSSFNGKDWDESLPTDCDIIMHLIASYLDTQLMPLPSMPDIKPFSGFHFIKYKDKLPTLTPNNLYIQQVSDKPPHYRVIVGETIYEMVKGYSNLFHTVLFFLYQVNKREHGMLGRVNLGRGGVNMLWIIDQ